MKKLILIFAFIFSTGLCVGQEFIEVSKSLMLNKEKLLLGYSPQQSELKPDLSRQPLTSKEEIEQFLFKLNYDNPKALPPIIYNWLAQNLSSYHNDAAIIFVRHPLIVEKLFDTTMNVLNRKYNALCKEKEIPFQKYNTFKAHLDTLTSLLANTYSEIQTVTTDIAATKDLQVLTRLKRKLKTLNTEENLLVSKINRITPIVKQYREEYTPFIPQLDEIKKNFLQASRSIVEDTTKVLTTVLAKENFEWSDYLLHKRNVMLVFLGGESTFKVWKLQITNGKKNYEKEFSDLMLVYQSITGTGFSLSDNQAIDPCTLNDDNPSQIPLTFALLQRKKIDPPTDIDFITKTKETKPLNKIHEKSYLGIKLGVSLLNIDNKNFKLNSNNELTVQTDSLNPDDLKLNVMALFELYPFGRDYDRLKLVTDENNIPIYERLGLVAGVKVSKDPLETIFMGGSFAMSKAFNIVSGISFTKIAKEVDELQVGLKTTLDYLRRHADKEYIPKFYVGLSLTPEALFKALGIKK